MSHDEILSVISAMKDEETRFIRNCILTANQLTK